MKQWGVLVGAILTQILGDGEEVEREAGRKEMILIVGQLEQLNNTWDNTDENYYRREDEIEVYTWDVAAMYPNLKIAYIVKEIDERIVERIGRLKGEERVSAETLREIVMPLMIFMLEHHFVYVLSEGKDEEKVFYWQKEGIGIGSSASGAIANLTLLGGSDACSNY